MAAKKTLTSFRAPLARVTAPATEEQFLAGATMQTRLEVPAPSVSFPQSPQAPASVVDEAGVYRTVNVKLTKSRYKRFKLLSTVTEVSMQQRLVELIDKFIQENETLLPRE